MKIVKNLIYAIIPARSGSKGIPNKNIILLNNFPLIAYSIKAALNSKLIDKVIVSTDSKKYSKIAKSFGADVPFLRPASISKDKSTDLEFMTHLIEWLKINRAKVPEFFVHLRPTTPLRETKIIDKAISQFKNTNYSSLRSVHEMSESSYKNFEIKNKNLVSIFKKSRKLDNSNKSRQDFPKTYDANGYVDVLRTKLIIDKKKIHGDNVYAFKTKKNYELDVISDIDIIEFFLSKNKKIINNLFF